MSDGGQQPLSRLGGDSVIYAVSSVVGQLGSLLTFPLYTRALGPASYGILAIGIAASGVIKTLVIAGTNTALMNARIGAEQHAAEEATAAAISWVVAACVLLAVLWALFGPGVASAARLGAQGVAFGWAVLAFVAVDSLLELVLSCARALAKPRAYALANALRVIVTMVVAVCLLLLVHTGAVGAIIAMAAASATAGLWLWFRLGLRASFGNLLPRIQRLVADGAPLLPANLGSWVTDLADRYLLLFMTGSAVLVGVYSAGYRVGALITVLFVQPFHTAYLPFMLEHADHEQADRLYSETTRLFLGFGAVAVLGLQALATPLVRVLAGRAYLSSVRIVGIVALGCLLGGAAMLMTPKALKARRTSTLAWAFGAGAIVNVAINLALIPKLGMYGAALATMLAYAVVLAVMLAVTPASSRPEGMVGELARLLPVAAAATLIAGIDMGDPVRQGLLGLASAVVGVALLLIAGAVRIKDVRRLLESLMVAVRRRSATS